jgi:sodium/bile acid cotransporter 7
MKGQPMPARNRCHQTKIFSIALFHFIALTLWLPPLVHLAAASMSDAEKRQRIMEMYADYREHFAGVAEIGAEEAIALLPDPDVVFVDVREPEEQAVSMIPGAITDKEFKTHLDQYRGKRLIAYCTISYRSGKLAARLARQGVTVVNLEAGLLGWVHAGGPLVRGDSPVRQLHVYGRKWDLAPADIETVY